MTANFPRSELVPPYRSANPACGDRGLDPVASMSALASTRLEMADDGPEGGSRQLYRLSVEHKPDWVS